MAIELDYLHFLAEANADPQNEMYINRAEVLTTLNSNNYSRFANTKHAININSTIEIFVDFSKILVDTEVVNLIRFYSGNAPIAEILVDITKDNFNKIIAILKLKYT